MTLERYLTISLHLLLHKFKSASRREICAKVAKIKKVGHFEQVTKLNLKSRKIKVL